MGRTSAAPNPELQGLITEAMKCGQAANEAQNAIDQSKFDKAAFDAIYQLGEAVGALTSALEILATT